MCFPTLRCLLGPFPPPLECDEAFVTTDSGEVLLLLLLLLGGSLLVAGAAFSTTAPRPCCSVSDDVLVERTERLPPPPREDEDFLFGEAVPSPATAAAAAAAVATIAFACASVMGRFVRSSFMATFQKTLFCASALWAAPSERMAWTRTCASCFEPR